jgi:hypothetical protein
MTAIAIADKCQERERHKVAVSFYRVGIRSPRRPGLAARNARTPPFSEAPDHAMTRPDRRALLWLALLFAFGSAYPVLNSAVLVGACPWRSGLTLQFRKPWFQLTITLLGMAAVALPSALCRRLPASHPLRVSIGARLFRRAAAPALCCAAACALRTKALVAMPPGVWQAFFGFRRLFAAAFRGRAPLLRDWGGLFLCASGMALSGAAALARGAPAAPDILGAFLVAIASHALQALQALAEERLLRDGAAGAATLAACEGLWGAAIAILVLIPIAAILSPAHSLGLYENPAEAFELLAGSARLALMVAAFFVCVTTYAFFAVVAAGHTSAVQRSLCEAATPLGVWAIAAVAHALSTDSAIGEPIDRYAILEVAGFLVTAGGVVVSEKPAACERARDADSVVSQAPLLLRDEQNEVESINAGEYCSKAC